MYIENQNKHDSFYILNITWTIDGGQEKTAKGDKSPQLQKSVDTGDGNRYLSKQTKGIPALFGVQLLCLQPPNTNKQHCKCEIIIKVFPFPVVRLLSKVISIAAYFIFFL